MRYFRIILLLLVGASLQTLLPSPAILGSMNWPILLGLVLCISLKSELAYVLYTGLLAGLFHDAFSPAPLGISVPFFLLIALGTYALREEVFGDQLITYAVLGLLGALCKTLYFAIVFSATGLRPIGTGYFTNQLFGSLLLGAGATLLVFLVLAILPYEQNRRARWVNA